MSKQEDFLALYEPEREKLERFVLFLTHNREDAKDIIGDTLLAAYERFEGLRDRKAFLSFLFTIASRRCNEWRRSGKRFPAAGADPDEIFSARQLNPEDSTDIAILLDSLGRLPERQAEALILAEIMGFSHREVQRIQGGTIAAVKVRIFRAKVRLRHILFPGNTERSSETLGLTL